MQAEAGASLTHATTSDHPSDQPRRRPSPRHLALVGVSAALAYALDQASKQWALAHLDDGRSRDLIGSFLRLRLTHNPGAAFSLGTNSTLVITAIACVVVIAVLVSARKLRSGAWALAFGLIVGGALGNLHDRFLRPPGGGKGYVVDFLQLPHWPIFNIADSAICTAAALVVVLTFRGIGLDGLRDDERQALSEGEAPSHRPDEERE